MNIITSIAREARHRQKSLIGAFIACIIIAAIAQYFTEKRYSIVRGGSYGGPYITLQPHWLIPPPENWPAPSSTTVTEGWGFRMFRASVYFPDMLGLDYGSHYRMSRTEWGWPWRSNSQTDYEHYGIRMTRPSKFNWKSAASPSSCGSPDPSRKIYESQSQGSVSARLWGGTLANIACVTLYLFPLAAAAVLRPLPAFLGFILGLTIASIPPLLDPVNINPNITFLHTLAWIFITTTLTAALSHRRTTPPSTPSSGTDL